MFVRLSLQTNGFATQKESTQGYRRDVTGQHKGSRATRALAVWDDGGVPCGSEIRKTGRR